MSTPFQAQLGAFRPRLEAALASFLATRRQETAARAPAAAELYDHLESLVAAGGKRLRPALVHFAYVGCGGTDERPALDVAMATELLHTYLLVHDDIMDHAATRRGVPAAHTFFHGRHAASGWRGDATDYGVSMGILEGDLAQTLAIELFVRALPGRRDAATLAEIFFAMCREVIDGQYLEMHLGLERDPGPEELARVLRLKSGLYSVERPLQLGATMAGASAERLAALSRYGQAMGEAFQLQDDLLGVFGDPATTGKPVGEDLKEGKFTFLVHHAFEASSPAEQRRLRLVLGDAEADPREIAAACKLLETSGAAAAVAAMIAERSATARAAAAAAGLDEAGETFLVGLVDYLQNRSS